eukprot:gene9059-11097_t
MNISRLIKPNSLLSRQLSQNLSKQTVIGKPSSNYYFNQQITFYSTDSATTTTTVDAAVSGETPKPKKPCCGGKKKDASTASTATTTTSSPVVEPVVANEIKVEQQQQQQQQTEVVGGETPKPKKACCGGKKKDASAAGATTTTLNAQQQDTMKQHIQSYTRRAIFALRAFNIETVGVDSNAKEERISKIKLKFWKDAINNIYDGKVVDQPLIRVLAQMIKTKNLSKTWFIKLLNRRDRDLHSVQIKTMEELEAYAEDIHSSLLYLSLESLGVKNSDAEHCASHLGRAIGIMTLIRGTPFNISRRKLYIPVTLTTKYGINPELLFQGDLQLAKLKEAIYEMASVAKIHLEKARAFKNIPPPANEAFLIAQIVEQYLEELRRSDFNVFDSDVGRVGSFTLLKMWWNRYKGKF